MSKDNWPEIGGKAMAAMSHAERNSEGIELSATEVAAINWYIGEIEQSHADSHSENRLLKECLEDLIPPALGRAHIMETQEHGIVMPAIAKGIRRNVERAHVLLGNREQASDGEGE
jgi:hypothetical protein